MSAAQRLGWHCPPLPGVPYDLRARGYYLYSRPPPLPPLNACEGSWLWEWEQVKIYSPGYIEQCAAGPSCPVRGGVGCKRCSSSVSCVGWVYVCALSLRCCVFFSLRVLALVSPSFQVREWERPPASRAQDHLQSRPWKSCNERAAR